MKYVVMFEDSQDADADVRRTRMSEHLAFLELNSRKIQAAGPLEAPDGRGPDGLWIVDAEDTAEVEVLIREDPFWSTGLRKSVRILAWNQVYAAGRRLIEC